ncbi:MAG TPA: hypothetical protein VG675_16360 [Bryobacteraceae bacterium]|nr:hypothetical protein [Bryobacteraceae bacterium]
MPTAALRATDIWKPLVICPHAEMSQRICSAMTEIGFGEVCHIAEYPRMGAIAGVAAQHGCNICFLDMASNQEHALLLVSEAAPGLPVVALNPRNDADLILRCLRRGACEFLAEPGGEQVAGVLERLARKRSPVEQRKTGKVYCIIPGKAGCGASTLALHLAVELRRCASSGKTLLVDADSLSGSLAFLLKLKPEFHLGDALRDCDRMDDDLWARMAASACGIDVLAAPQNPWESFDVDRHHSADLLAFWRDRYESVVLDTPGVQLAVNAGFANLAEEVLLVTTNELASLHATRRALEYLEHTGIDRKHVRLVVNRYTPVTGLKRDDVLTALKLEAFAILGNDYDAVQNAVLEGKPVAVGTRFGRSIQTLVQQLGGSTVPEKKSGNRLVLRYLRK